jgi:hypothetical protein
LERIKARISTWKRLESLEGSGEAEGEPKRYERNGKVE